jgi:hypothetical protein
MPFILDAIEIHHDSKERRFFFPIEDHKDAQINYELNAEADPNIIDFTHTYVSPENREKGIGKKLAETAIRFAIENNFKIKTSCSFVRDYMESRDDYKKLLQN